MDGQTDKGQTKSDHNSSSWAYRSSGELKIQNVICHIGDHTLPFSGLINSADDNMVIFYYFSKKTGFDFLYQILFSGKNKKTYFKMWSTEDFTQSATC